MTLLEALAALVILGVSALGYLELFHGAQRSVRDAARWSAAASRAASALEEATLPTPPGTRQVDGVRVERRQWPGSERLTDIMVTVTTPDGTTMTVHRLTRVSR